MALRARLATPPPPPRDQWPWHKSTASSISVSLATKGDRRLDAGAYLSSGFGIRIAIENSAGKWEPLGKLAKIWVPPRIKMVLVDQEFGAPYLNTSQVFDIRATPRKWLSLEKTGASERRVVPSGTILAMASADVGRSTITTAAHEGCIVSHHFMRIEPIDDQLKGWLYACLKSAQFRAMVSSSQYASIIRHVEPHHLAAIPVPTIGKPIARRFAEMLDKIIALRGDSHRLTLAAESEYAKALGGELPLFDGGERGFVLRSASALSRGRRRFDATVHSPAVTETWRHLETHGRGFTSISDAGYEVWLPKRFRRIPAPDGIPLLDSADLMEVNPSSTKRIADGDFGDSFQGRVKAGWVLMARSGQTYGIIGTTVLATADLEGKIISDHIMRMRPPAQPEIAPGYLAVALGHPRFGRPLVKALAYGSSIPEIEVSDMAVHRIVRLGKKAEQAVSLLAEQAVESRASADRIEQAMAIEASDIIGDFIANKVRVRYERDTAEIARHILDTIAPDA